MIVRILSAAAMLFLNAVGPGKAQIELPEWDSVEIITEDLGNHIVMLQGFGSNVGAYTGPNGIFLVDNEYAPLSEKLMAALEQISDQPVRYVVNTHWHQDHRDGNENFVKAGAVIVAQKDTRRIMALAQNDPDLKTSISASAQTLPSITYDKTISFYMGDEHIEVRHIPFVHTSGDSLVIFHKADIIQTGDMYFNGFYPFIDVPFGGSIDNMISFYDELYALAGPDTKIIPGHGPVSNREEVRTYQAMLRIVRARVANAIEKGNALDALKKAKPLADLDAQWGDNLITADWLLEMVYADLVKHGVKPLPDD